MRRTFTNGESVTPLLQGLKQSQKRSNAWALLLLSGALFSALCVVGLLKTSGRFEQLSEFTVGSGTSKLDDIAVKGPDTPQRRAPNVPVDEDEEIAVGTPWSADDLGPCQGLKFGNCRSASLWNDAHDEGDKMWVVCQNVPIVGFSQSCAIQVDNGFNILDIKTNDGYGTVCTTYPNGKPREIGHSLWDELKITFKNKDYKLSETSLQNIQPCADFRTSYVDEMFYRLDPTQRGQMSNWMAKLDQTKSILNVKIPGTHDSGTFAAAQSWKTFWSQTEAHAKSTTQDINILRSLQVGIRAVDLRIASYKITDLMCESKIGIGHGAWGSNLCLEDVLGEIKAFLKENKEEIILVNIQIEGSGIGPGIKTTALMKKALDAIHKFAFEGQPTAAPKILEENGQPKSGSVHTLKGLRGAQTRIILITEEFLKDATSTNIKNDLITGGIDKCCGHGGECALIPADCEEAGKYGMMKQYFWEQYGWYAELPTREAVVTHIKDQAVKFENKKLFDNPGDSQSWGKKKQTSNLSVGREGRLFNQKFQISPTLVTRLGTSLWSADTKLWNVIDGGKSMCTEFTQPIQENGRALYSSMNVVWFDFVGTKMYPLWYLINLQLDAAKRITVPEKLDYTNPMEWMNGLPEDAKKTHNPKVYVDGEPNVDTVIVERPNECVVNDDSNPCSSPTGCERKNFGENIRLS